MKFLFFLKNIGIVLIWFCLNFQAPVDEAGGVQGKSSRGATTQDSKKINDYFAKQQGTSPVRHGGAKSPSAQPSYPMVRFILQNLKKEK